MIETQTKLKKIREFLSKTGSAAVLLRGTDWFYWLTGGGNNSVLLTSESGVAEALITETKAFILTDPIEESRLKREELPASCFEVVVFPWWNPLAASDFVRAEVKRTPLLTDRPLLSDERRLPASFRKLRAVLTAEEIKRYRGLGKEAAEAMYEALLRAQPTWTERQLAAEGMKNLFEKGIHPALVLVAGERRLPLYRHPLPTEELLGSRAMMVFCARRHGLYANLTRFVAFSPLSAEEERNHDLVAGFEDLALSASRPGATLEEIYFKIRKGYAAKNLEAEADRQHFGGTTGYLSRERIARPVTGGEEPWVLSLNQALAWNPTLPGAKIEDTILLTGQGIEFLTLDSAWPSKHIVQKHHRLRPEVWIRQ